MGLLIADARNSLRRSVAECAGAAGVSPEQFAEYEKGNSAPSLPQLELLAHYLNMPIEHFWGQKALVENAAPELPADKARLVLLRDRVIGANLRLARNNAGLSYAEVEQKTGVTEDQMKRYEQGEQPTPASELELLASAFDMPVERFYDQHGPIGKWRAQQSSYRQFSELPPEIQAFVTRPVNRPYLELAIRLSELSADKLRAVAEVLLEITY